MVLLVVLAAASCPHALAQREKPAPRFILEYVPADELATWQVGHTRYRPTEAAEFEELTRLARESGTGDVHRPVRIGQAEYDARLEGDALLRGHASLHVDMADEAPRLLPLDPCRLAVTDVRWQQDQHNDVLLGVNRQQRMAVLVNRSGVLELDWLLQLRHEATDTYSGELELPECASSSLMLDLPERVSPLISAGVVIGPLESPEAGRRRWRVELGGNHRVTLRIAPGEVARQAQAVTLLRESFTYDFSARGVELTATLDLEALSQPVRRVEVVLDPGLQLVSAQIGESPLEWSLLPAADGQAGRRVAFELPESLVGLRQTLGLRAWTPLVTDQRWTLPAIRTSGVHWLQGRATLRVPYPLVVSHLEPLEIHQVTSGRQVETTPLAAPQRGESLVVEYYSGQAAVELEVMRREPQVSVAVGTSLEWSADEIAGLSVLDIELQEDQLFSLSCEVPKQWTIDSIVSQPLGAVADWRRHGGKGSTDNLELRLSRPLVSGQPLRLTLTGRLLRPPIGEPLKVSELQMLTMTGAVQSDWMLGIRSQGPFRLQAFEAQGLNVVEPQTVEDTWLERLDGLTFDLLFRPAQTDPDMGVALFPAGAGYDADVGVEVALSDKTLWEALRIQCHPVSGQTIERVLVYLPQASVDEPRWSITEDNEANITARRLPPDHAEVQAAGGGDGEYWELKLAQPRTKTFELQGRRSIAFNDAKLRLNLPSVPSANRQRTSLVVRSLGAEMLSINGNGLIAAPLPVAAGDLPGIAQAAFHTAVAQRDAGSGYVELSRRDVAVNRRGLIWSAVVESRYETHGDATHVATYRLQNMALDALEVRLPIGAKALGVWVQGQPAGAGNSETVRVTLPSSARFVTVRLEFRTQQTPFSVYNRLQAPLPQVDLPVVSQQVTVWCPPGMEVREHSSDWQLDGAAAVGWMQQLLGPFANEARPADPADAEAWRTLLPQEWYQAHLARVQKFRERLTAWRKTGSGTWQQFFEWWATHWPDERLMVIPDALTANGIRPAAMIPVKSAGDDEYSLIATDDGLLLSGPEFATRHRAQLAPLAADAFVIRSAEFAAAINRALDEQQPGIVSTDHLEDWQVPLWHATGGVLESSPADTAQWNAYRFDGTDGHGDLEFVVVEAHALTAIAWGVFLVSLATGFRLARKLRRLVIALILSLAATLVAPLSVAPIAAAVVLGLLLVMIGYGLVPRPLGTGRENADTVTVQRRVLQTTGAVVGLLTLLVASGAWGQNAEPPLYHVLIPVGANGKPVAGARYQVPVDLYTHLRREAEQAGSGSSGWMLSDATYEGTLSREPAGFVLPQLTAKYRLRTFSTAVVISLPFQQTELEPGSMQVLLDGRQVRVDWAAGQPIRFLVPDVGDYRLEVQFRPKQLTSEGASGIDLSIPPLATSKVDFGLPARSPAIEVLEALGPVEADMTGRRLRAHLGPLSTLSIRWREDDPAGGGYRRRWNSSLGLRCSAAARWLTCN